MRHPRTVVMLSAALTVLLAVAALEAADPMVRSQGSGTAAPAGQAINASPVDTPVKILGVQVFIDPKTGLMRTPSPEEAAALNAELWRLFGSPAEEAKALPAPVVLANGTMKQRLDSSLMNVSVAHIHPGGELSFDCVKGHDHENASAAVRPAGPETE